MAVITIDNVEDFPAAARGAFVTIGNFDGVHRGHRRLDRPAAPEPMRRVFPPWPSRLTRIRWPSCGRTRRPCLWSGQSVRSLFWNNPARPMSPCFARGAGCWISRPASSSTALSADQIAARGIVEGPNFAFGHDREGDVALLGQWCRASGIDFEVVDPIEEDGRLISSSRIREALRAGSVEEASKFLGRPHRIRGIVAHGSGRGAGIGVPTVNLEHIDTLIPADGVYATRALLNWPLTPQAAHRLGLAGRVPHRAQRHLRRACSNSGSASDRLRGRSLRPEGRA